MTGKDYSLTNVSSIMEYFAENAKTVEECESLRKSILYIVNDCFDGRIVEFKGSTDRRTWEAINRIEKILKNESL